MRGFGFRVGVLRGVEIVKVEVFVLRALGSLLDLFFGGRRGGSLIQAGLKP